MSNGLAFGLAIGYIICAIGLIIYEYMKSKPLDWSNFRPKISKEDVAHFGKRTWAKPEETQATMKQVNGHNDKLKREMGQWKRALQHILEAIGIKRRL